MKKLATPYINARDTLLLCKKGISTISLNDRLQAGLEELTQLGNTYENLASNGALFQVSPLAKNCDENAVVTAEITKKEFVNLYEYYLRGPDKPGRDLYDRLFLAAEDKCPFCGGIGQPRNLDHFMPKSFFPQFSILPFNLVPSCRDCNMDGKGQSYAATESEQIIHPYLDNERFFVEQWVSARVVEEYPCSVEFFVNAPDQWRSVDKLRVNSHFNDFDIAKRYGIQSGDELSTLISQRRRIMSQYSPIEFSQYLASFLDSPLFVNHWKKVLYQCLSANEWFCNYNF